MKLTKYHRSAFVRAVMDDVPTVDYQTEVHALILEDSIKQLPEKLQKIARDKELSQYLARTHCWLREFDNLYVFAQYNGDFKRSPECDAKFEELNALQMAQNQARAELRNKLDGVIRSCTTDVQVRKALPEFSKYLPEAESPVDRTVPVIANLVADLMSMGWPKDKEAVPA